MSGRGVDFGDRDTGPSDIEIEYPRLETYLMIPKTLFNTCGDSWKNPIEHENPVQASGRYDTGIH